MIGFWTPIFSFLTGILSTWGQWLIESMPAGFGRHFYLIAKPYEINITTIDEIEPAFAAAPQGHDVLVKLDQGLMIKHECKIPDIALGEASKVVTLEAERILPLTTDKLFVSYAKVGLSVNQQQDFEIIAARKQLIDQIFSVAQKYQRHIADIAVENDDGDRKTYFSLSKIKRRKLLRIAAVLSVGFITFIILGTLPSVYMSRLHSETSDVDLSIREARKQTESIAGLQRQVKAMQDLSDAVKTVKGESNLLELFVELTKASPKNIFFTEFRLEGRKVFISGQAHAPEMWVISLEDNPAFQNVLLSSVLDVTGAAGKKFEVRLDAVWLPERQAK